MLVVAKVAPTEGLGDLWPVDLAVTATPCLTEYRHLQGVAGFGSEDLIGEGDGA